MSKQWWLYLKLMSYKQFIRDPIPDLRYKDVIFSDSDVESKVDQMSDDDAIEYTSDIEITGKQSSHPRERLKWKFKQKNVDIKFLIKTPQQS